MHARDRARAPNCSRRSPACKAELQIDQTAAVERIRVIRRNAQSRVAIGKRSLHLVERGERPAAIVERCRMLRVAADQLAEVLDGEFKIACPCPFQAASKKAVQIGGCIGIGARQFGRIGSRGSIRGDRCRLIGCGRLFGCGRRIVGGRRSRFDRRRRTGGSKGDLRWRRLRGSCRRRRLLMAGCNDGAGAVQINVGDMIAVAERAAFPGSLLAVA